MSEPNTPQNNPEQDPQERLEAQSNPPSEAQDSPEESLPLNFEAPIVSPLDPASQKLPTSPPEQPPRVAPALQQPTPSATDPQGFPPRASSQPPGSPTEDDPWSTPAAPTVGAGQPVASSRLSVAQPTAAAPVPTRSSGSGLTLQTLLERPKHRWMVPAGFLMILGAFGLIGLVAVQGDAELPAPVPEVAETQ